MARLRQPAFDWLTGTNPDVLLKTVWPGPFEYAPVSAIRDLPPAMVRRLRLYGTACARMVWNVLTTEVRNAILVCERHADGRATLADLRATAVRMQSSAVTFQQQAANAAGWASVGYWSGVATEAQMWNPAAAARDAAKSLATRTAGPAPPGGNPVAKEWQIAWNTAFAEARAHQAELIRDIFPPPGYTPVLHPDWRTSTVLTLARQADDSGEYSALPILADALQDAGCDDEVMLDRCRASSGIHCRGNWVVDLVLGRE